MTLVALFLIQGVSSSAGASRDLGVVVPGGAAAACPAGATCETITVTCEATGLTKQASIAQHGPYASVDGTVVLTTGGTGGAWFSDEAPAGSVEDLEALGLAVVELSWSASWMESAPGQLTGPAAMACFPATAIDYIHTTLHAPLGVSPAFTGDCGFCLTGNSAGASQIAYALAFYDLGPIIDGFVSTGGPPHASIDQGCLGAPGFGYSGSAAVLQDSSFGGPSGPQPCANQDGDFVASWQANSLGTATEDGCHESTRIVVLIGDADVGHLGHAETYTIALIDAGSPMVTSSVVEGVSHGFHRDVRGMDLIVDGLADSASIIVDPSACSSEPMITPTPTPNDPRPTRPPRPTATPDDPTPTPTPRPPRPTPTPGDPRPTPTPRPPRPTATPSFPTPTPTATPVLPTPTPTPVVPTATATPGPTIECGGRVPTIVGTDADETIHGTDGPDVIAGLGGDDIIDAMAGDDVLCGGDGDDRLLGGRGDDVYFGGAGDDICLGAAREPAFDCES